MGNKVKGGQEAIDLLGQSLKGQASAGADTFTGKIKEMKARVEDAVSTFGQRFGPSITIAGAAMTGLGSALEVGKAAMTAYKTATEGQTIAQWALNVAMDANPIMIVVLAIAALVAALILLYTHSQLVRDIVADMGHVFSDVFSAIVNFAQAAITWISNNWPLILAILTGPFGLAVYFIASYWDQIVGFAESIPGRILAALSSLGSLLVGAGSALIGGMMSGINAGWGAITGFIGGIPGAILGALGDVTNLLYNAGKTIIDSLGRGIKDAFEAVKNTVGGIASTIASLKGPLSKDRTLLVPAGNAIMQGLNDSLRAGMPSLASTLADVSGTIILSSSGSRQAPAPAPGPQRIGPAVVIEHAEFREEADITVFMRRAAWEVTRSGV